MAIIRPSDLATNIYAEIITEITRNEENKADIAISTAVQEAKMYLARYDLLQLFGDDDRGILATVYDEYLNSLIKDLACWHLLRVSNANTDLSIFRTAYQDAITALKSIMAGQANPQGWPYTDTTNQTAPEGNTINWSSNPRRNNFY
ncbi:MAG: hypothetical protein JWQ38_3395 [Flavipsychrobacter sp.]|nr:hypothetical protein [Flavipsychrobacter sp.]